MLNAPRNGWLRRTARSFRAVLPFAAGVLTASCDDSDPARPGDSGPLGPEGGDAVVVFADSLVERAVRANLDRPAGPIRRSDIEPVTFLEVRVGEGGQLRSLGGIEFLSSLEELRILPRNGPITPPTAPLADLGPLAALRKLRTLNVSTPTRITDLEPLRDVAGLEALVLVEADVTDLSPLARLEKLGFLILSMNRVEDIGPLRGLTALTHLDLSHNRVRDLGPLRKLTRLTAIDLSHNRIEEVRILAELPLSPGFRRTIYLSGNPLSRRALCDDFPALIEKTVPAAPGDGVVDLPDLQNIDRCPPGGG